MRKLLPIFLLGVGLAVLSDKLSVVGYDKHGDKIYRRKEKFLFILMAIILVVFVGLRTNYNDTGAYRHAYELITPGLENIANVNLDLGANPGFFITNLILKTIGFSTQSFLMFYAIITVGIYLWFIRKYADNLWLSVFLFFTMGCYTFTMAAIKQCVAVAFCLVATDRFIQKKNIKFVFWVLVASTFHPYSLMYLIVPFLNFEPWCWKTLFLLILFALIGFGMQSLIGTVIDITMMLGEEYDASTFMGEGINIFRLAVVWVPVVVSFVTRNYLKANNTKADNIILNLSILNAEIMFVGLFGTANYFGRLANYFLIFQALCLPHLFKGFTKESKQIISLLCVVGFILYFYYANVINQNFDAMFRSISFFEYLKNIGTFL